jgi:hypothetical protein
MRFEELSPRQVLEVSRQAARLCAGRYRELAATSDPGDEALHRLLETQAGDEGACAEEIEQLAEAILPDSDPSLDERAGRTLIADHLPSLTRRLGEGPLDRDIALYVAECLQEESSRFHRALADFAPDEESQTLLERVALREWAHLAQLRSVLS